MTEETPLHTMLVRRGSDSHSCESLITKLAEADIPAVMQLQAMAGTNLFVPLTEQELIHYMGAEGVCLGAWIHGDLAGFRCIAFPGYAGDHLGRDIGWTDDRLLMAAHLEAAVVHPDYRGNGLQYTMADLAIEHFVKPLGYRYLFATVAPANAASLRTLFKLGMSVVRLLPKYGGEWRYVMMLDLQRKIEHQHESRDSLSAFVAIDRLEEQAELLKYGGRGISLSYGNEGWTIEITLTK
jgi:ribosomal protein S18 acetylase RimI-like enzyme